MKKLFISEKEQKKMKKNKNRKIFNIAGLAAVITFIFLIPVFYLFIYRRKKKNSLTEEALHKSIDNYGNLAEKKNQKIKITHQNEKYYFQISGKNKIEGFEKFNRILHQQGVKENYDIDSLIVEQNKSYQNSRFVFDAIETPTNAKAKAKKDSITSFGELKNGTITVDYDKSNYTFQIDSKNLITSLEDLNKQLNFQGDTTITDYTIDNLPSSLSFDHTSFTKAKAKKTSIETYGNLSKDKLIVFYEENYKFNVKNKRLLNSIVELKNKYNEQKNKDDQEVTWSNIEEIEEAKRANKLIIDTNTLNIAKGKAKAKKDSITRYGDLKSGTIIVDYVNSNYTFQIDSKNLMTSLGDLNTELNLQNDTKTNYKITNLPSFLTIDHASFSKAKAKKDSIATYGNLKTDTIKVSYDSNYKFNVKNKRLLNSIVELKNKYNEQKNKNDQEVTWSNIEEIEEAKRTNKLIIDTNTLEFSKAKKQAKEKKALRVISVTKYGDLTNELNVYYEESQFKFNVGSKKKLLINDLKTQYKIQTGRTLILTIEEVEANTNKINLNLISLNLSKKMKSWEIFGDLTDKTNNDLKVIYQDNQYQFQIGKKRKIKSFVKFNNVLRQQGIQTNFNIDSLIVESRKNQETSLFVFDKNKTPLKAKSIARYGDLTNSSNIINVSFDRIIKYTVNDQEINFDQLKAEALKQGITLTSEARLTNNSVLISLNETELIKAKSIARFGDLTDSRNIINVSFDRIIKYTVNEQELNFNQLKTQALKQGITLTSEARLTNNSVLVGLNETELTKAKSIARFGDLTDSRNIINVSFDRIIKYTVNEQELNFNQLKTQALKQGITLTSEERLTNNSVLVGLNKAELIKAKSIARHGDLTGKTNQEKLKITYGPVSFRSSGGDIRYMYKFEADNNFKILSFDEFNEQLKKQGIRSNYDINSLIADFEKEPETSIFVFDDSETPANAKAKAESIARYGDLIYLNPGTLGVSYNGTNFVYHLDTKDPIIGIEAFKAQYDLQSGTENELTTFNQVKRKVLATKFKTGELKKASKAESIAIYGDLTGKTNQKKLKITYEIESITEKNQDMYRFMIDNKQKIISFDQFNQELKKQGIQTNYVINSLIWEYRKTPEASIFVFDDIETPIKAKDKEVSILLYGDLTGKTNQEKLKITYRERNYEFQVGNKHILNSFDRFNQQLIKQGIQLNFDIDSLIAEFRKEPEASIFVFDDIETPIKAKAKAMKTSIENFGDLIVLPEGTLGVSYNETNFVFQIDTKNPIIGIEAFKAQYDLQSGTENELTTIEEIEAKISIARFKDGQLAIAKSAKTKADKKATSIDQYGDLLNLENGRFGISYVRNNFVFQIDTKNPITGIESFKTQYDLQSEAENELTTIEEIEAKIGIAKFKNGELVTAKNGKILAKAKKDSIARYGNLRSQTINVSYNVTDGAIKYTVNNQTPINFDQLRVEATKQRITALTIETELTDNSDLGGLVTSELTKAKAKQTSIDQYGDLTGKTNQEKLKITYGDVWQGGKKNLNYKFQIGNKHILTSFGRFQQQLIKQGIQTNYDINSLIVESQKRPEVSRFAFDTIKTPAKAKAKAIKNNQTKKGSLKIKKGGTQQTKKIINYSEEPNFNFNIFGFNIFVFAILFYFFILKISQKIKNRKK